MNPLKIGAARDTRRIQAPTSTDASTPMPYTLKAIISNVKIVKMSRRLQKMELKQSKDEFMKKDEKVKLKELD